MGWHRPCCILKANTVTSLKKTILTGFCALAAFGTVSTAHAAPITYDFTSAGTSSATNTVAYGVSKAYTVNGETITAYAGTYSNSVVTRLATGNGTLVGNNRGPDEQGLGVCVGSTSNGSTCSSNGNNPKYANDPEINYGSELVQLDITNLLKDGYTSLSVNADSATDGEKLAIYSSTSSTGLGVLEASITSEQGTVAIYQNGNYLNFISANAQGGDDVLLHSLTASMVPEPMSMALLGVGMIGTRAVARRRARRSQASI